LEIIQRRCEEAASHVVVKKNGKQKQDGPEGKRFTIDKAVITLTDFVEQKEIKVIITKKR